MYPIHIGKKELEIFMDERRKGYFTRYAFSAIHLDIPIESEVEIIYSSGIRGQQDQSVGTATLLERHVISGSVIQRPAMIFQRKSIDAASIPKEKTDLSPSTPQSKAPRKRKTA